MLLVNFDSRPFEAFWWAQRTGIMIWLDCLVVIPILQWGSMRSCGALQLSNHRGWYELLALLCPPHSSSWSTMNSFCITQPHLRRWLIRGWWCMVAMMATSGWPTCTFSTLSSFSKTAAAHSFFLDRLTDPKPPKHQISKKSMGSAGWKRQWNHIRIVKATSRRNMMEWIATTMMHRCQTCREFHSVPKLLAHRNTSD